MLNIPLEEQSLSSSFVRTRALLCDLDGTLVDSAEDIRAALNIALAESGLRALTSTEIKSMIGDGSPVLVARALARTGGSEGLAERILTRYIAHYEANVAVNTKAYPGVVQTLAQLKHDGLKLAVVTNKLHAATVRLLSAIGLLGTFDVVIGGDSTVRRKPYPDPILAALRDLNINAAEAIMIGDNYHDVQAAKAAGVRAFAVTYGYSHKPHEELGADELCESFSCLETILRQ
jgi:phosphoglycolate phosphatase